MFLLEEVWLKYRHIVPSKITAPQYCVKKVESKTKLILFLITSYLTGGLKGPYISGLNGLLSNYTQNFPKQAFPQGKTAVIFISVCPRGKQL